MRRVLAAGLSLTATLLCGSGIAFARPAVALHLTGAAIERGTDGTAHSVALDRAPVAPGTIVRWQIEATNAGDGAAAHLVPSARIPAGTAYVPASASHNALRVEFSIDGGKTWATTPSVTVKTATGTVVRNAAPSTYTHVRWIVDHPLAPKTTSVYSYEVRVR